MIKTPSPLTGNTTIVVGVAALSGGVVVTPPNGGTTLNATNTASAGTGLTYTIGLAAGCANVVNNGTPHITFTAGGVNDVQVTVNTTLTSTTSALVGNVASLNVTCGKSGSTYVPGAAQTLSFTSPEPGGTAFTVDTVTNPVAAWLTLSSTAGGNATANPVSFTATPAAGCDALAVGGTATTTIHLLNPPFADKTIAVTLTVSAITSALVAPATVNVTCGKSGSNYIPGAAQTITVTSAAAGGTPFTIDTVTNPVAAWLTLSSTAGGTANSVGVSFTATAAAGCDSLAPGGTATTTIHLLNAPAPDKTITVNLSVTAIVSALSAPSTLTVVCGKSGSTYYPGEAQLISVTSSAANGTAFTVDTVTSPPAAWLSLSSTAGGTATASPVTFTVVPAAGCGGFALGTSNTTTIHLLNSPAPDKLIVVTMQIDALTPLIVTPAASTFSYIKGSGTPGYAQVNVTSNAAIAPFFTVDSTTLPAWLTTDTTNGTTPKSIRFSSTSVCDTLPPGAYNASVRLKVSGFADQIETITLLINNAAPKLSVVGGTTQNLSWVIGNPLPTPTITAQSTDTPIAYTVTTGGTLQPTVNETSGLAYNFGTPINVTFNPLVFAAAQPNTTLTGTVTLTWGSPASTIVVTFNVAVQSPGATLISLNPASLPTAAPGGAPFQVSLTGTGFVPSTNLTYATKVGLVQNGTIVTDPSISANIINPSNMTLTITVNAADNANLPFAVGGNGGSVTIGVCNPTNGTCTTPTGTAVLTIGTNPIVQAITSSSTLMQVTAPALPTIAPYDMISVWGANFCTSGGTGCSTNTVLFGSPDPVLQTYPQQLSPDSGVRNLSLQFLTHGTATVLGTAPLLFATNGQINALVPTGICPSGTCPATVDVVVTFGANSSTAYQVNVAATDPGIFTVGADGQGNGAILDVNWNLISSTNHAGVRDGGSGNAGANSVADSDTVQLYMTGLGIPDSSASGTGWSANCLSVANYLTAFNTAENVGLTSLDGALVLQSPLSGSQQVPCLLASGADAPTVTIGGVTATVAYAGWAPNEVAGLYQVNVMLPASTAGPFTTMNGTLTPATLTGPVQLPIVVTSNGVASQAGVAIWVAPKLLVSAPSGTTGTVGAAWPNTNNAVSAQDGVAPYTYAVTSGLLPSGVTLDPNLGTLSGEPAANTAGTYQVTVTATDSVAMTGSVSFTLTVNGGLYLTSSGASPYITTNGAANNSVTTVTAASGVAPYLYALTSPPTGVSIVPATGVVKTTAAVLAGHYHITATATDATPGTPLAGSSVFDIDEALGMSTGVVNTITASAGGTVATMSVTGASGTPTFARTAGPSCISVNSGGVVSADTTCSTGTFSVTITATDSAYPGTAFAAGTGSVTFNVTAQ